MMDTKRLIMELRDISNMRSASSHKRMICKMAAQRLERLIAYEETGLEPYICISYKKFEDEAISKGVPFSRIVELMETDRDGRLVVLPCKVGSPVYRIGASICKWRDADHCDTYCSGYEYEDCWEGERTVLEEKFSLNMLGKIGKTVFLTREEADAALEAQKGGECTK